MGVFSWFTDMFSSDTETSSIADDSLLSSSNTDLIGANTFDDFAVNPANGLPMVGGMGGVDVEGNPFGTDFSSDNMALSSFDDGFSSSSGSSFDDTWSSGSGSGSGSGFSDW